MKYRIQPARQAILDLGTMATLADMHFLIRADTTAQFGGYDETRSSGTGTATWQNLFPLAQYAGVWTHVATVYDPARATITTYIDGAKAMENPSPAFSLDAAGGLRIGRALQKSLSDFSFAGALDEIRFYNRALSADRIKLDFESQKP